MKDHSFRAKTLIYLVFAAIPFLLWIYGEGVQLDFSTLYAVLSTLGKGAGIIGISLFASNLILSGRYKFFDSLFGGLDRAFQAHRQTGVVAFSLLTLHVLAISFRPLAFSKEVFFNFLIDFSNLWITLGRITYLLFLVIIILTLLFSKRIKYEVVKKIHQWMGALLFFGAIHAFFIQSDLTQNQTLGFYVGTLVVVALLSYFIRTVLKRWFVSRIRAQVVAVNNLGGKVTEVVFKPVIPVSFEPGQFMFTLFRQNLFPYEDHPFSLTGAKEEGNLRISAKAIGDYTSLLPNIQPGAEVFLQGPFGGFTPFQDEKEKQVWIAGGIGITPFMSLVRTMAQDKSLRDRDIYLYYSVQTAEDKVFVEELERLSRELLNLKLTVWVSKEKGYLTAEQIYTIPDIKDRSVYICAPKPMMFALRDGLKKLGIKGKDIHFELFRLL